VTSPADQDVDNKLAGVSPTGGPLQYQYTPEAMGRCTWDNDDDIQPYSTTFTTGDPIVGSAATYDQVCSNLRLQGSRHVDPYGNVATPKKAWMLQWYWFLDGCPTNLTASKVAEYRQLASVLRDWPVGYPGSFQGEPTQDYSSVDQAAPLSSFVPPPAS
jgi:hypothetical protein